MVSVRVRGVAVGLELPAAGADVDVNVQVRVPIASRSERLLADGAGTQKPSPDEPNGTAMLMRLTPTLRLSSALISGCVRPVRCTRSITGESAEQMFVN